MTTRQLISDNGDVRRYRVLDDSGAEIGVDEEPAPGTAGANSGVLLDRARQALTANAAFLAIASPTNAQVVQQVQRLTRECSALIRLALNMFDTTDGT